MGALALAEDYAAGDCAVLDAPPEPSHYVALRCAGGATLGLTRKLLDTGASAWTPVVPQSRPVPRSRVRQWVMAPLLPTFVFLDSEALVDAREARDRFLLPSFTPLALAGELVKIRSAALAALREIEAGLVEKSRRRAPPGKKLGVGTRVTLLSEAFTGLTAEVRASSRRSCVVDIGGMRMTVPSFLLKEVAL